MHNLLSSLFFAIATLGVSWLVLTEIHRRNTQEDRLDAIDVGSDPAKIKDDEKETKSYAYLKRRERRKKAKELAVLFTLLSITVLLSLAWQLLSPGYFLVRLMCLLAFTLLIRRFLYVHRLRRRRTMMEDDLPAVLDLIVVCIEAGMSINSAIVRVSNEMSKSPLAEELRHTFHELNLGLPTEDAFLNLGERTKVHDLQALSTAIVQAQQMGISLGETLRNQAKVLRENIRLRTREKILKMPIKLIFPLIFFIMPAIFSVVAGPSFMQVLSGVLIDVSTNAQTGKLTAK